MADINNDFDKIYDLTKNEIYKYIAARCRCFDDIDDIFQDTYIDVYMYLKDAKEIDEPAAFIKTVAKRKLSKYYTLRKKIEKLIDRLTPIEQEVSTHDELMDHVNTLLLKKSPRVQRIFFMRHIMDMPFNEIALQLGLKEDTVKKSYYRIVDEIRRRLEKEELL